jgi:hypothetical protein
MTLTVDFRPDEEATLSAKAKAEGLSVEQWVRKQALAPAPQKSLAEKVREIWSDVPPEDWDPMPTDGASEHDHYIYGLPKRNV